MKITDFNIYLETFLLFLSIFLAILNIFQFYSSRKDMKMYRRLVRSWQHHAEGIKNSLLRLNNNLSKISDPMVIIGNIQALADQANSLNQAMTEERFYENNEKELKKKKEDNEKFFQDIFKPGKR